MTVKVRLAEIDAPEKAQPFGQRRRQALGALCFKRQATVSVQTKDRYGRSVARVECAGNCWARGDECACDAAWSRRRPRIVAFRELIRIKHPAIGASRLAFNPTDHRGGGGGRPSLARSMCEVFSTTWVASMPHDGEFRLFVLACESVSLGMARS